ncbi:MAG: hypothetical protein J6C87_06930 [Bacteroides sp.]|nr:hypothetical protein [Bacteroides sp.]
MKKIYSYFGSLLLMAGLTFTACTPEEFDGPVEAGILQVADVEDAINISVDQTTNQVTFSMDKKGAYPVWIFDGKTYSTVNGLQKIYTIAGDYSVEVKVGNANGVSDGSVTKSFHIDNTIFDFGKYETFLNGGASKVWYIAEKEVGHMGCGESGTDGLGWWSAQPGDKADWGVYDDALTFNADGSYVYNPGDGGTMYVNWGCSIYPEYNINKAEEQDFMAPVEEQTATWEFTVEGPDLYLVLPANTQFPYIPNDAFWANPRLKVLNMNAKMMELVYDEGTIAWHFILTTEREEVFNGFKYNSEFNLWKDATKETPTFYYAPDWAQIADPAYTVDGSTYTLTLPTATTAQWQAQMHIVTDIALNAATNYDFSVIINPSTPIAAATVKLTDTTSDSNFLIEQKVELKALEDNIVWFSDLPGIDAAAVKMVFDFGGNGDNCEVIIKNIVIKDHANDDGTVLPGATPEEEGPKVNWVDETSAENLWSTVNVTPTFWFADAGWAQIADPDYSFADGVHTVYMPTATAAQWQGQMTFANSGISTSADKVYDFRIILKSDKDIPAATIKLTKNDDDNTFYFADQVALLADEEYTFIKAEMPGIDIDNLKLVLDFGGNPEGTTVQIYGIILQERYNPNFNYDSACNMWKSCTYTNTFYYAPDWTQIADPTIETLEKGFKVLLPSATTAQWQAQVAFHTDMTTNSATNYDFKCVLKSNNDHPGVTIKLVLSGGGENDNVFYFADAHPLAAEEEYVYEMVNMPGIDMDKVSLFFDFGGCAADTEVTVTDIILKEKGCTE